MKNLIVSGFLATSASLLSSGASAQDVQCSGNPKDNTKSGCMTENRDYLAVVQKGKCSMRDALNPRTGKNGPSRALDIKYQVFSKYKDGNSKGMRHYRYVPFSVYGEQNFASCDDLLKYASRQVWAQLDRTK